MFFKKPLHDRDWSPDQIVLPHVDFLNGNHVRIHQIRNIAYRTEDDYDLSYYDAEFDLDQIESVWFLVAPFGAPGVAHTLMSFRFADDRALCLSIEIRKKKGERFSFKRIYPQAHELMYVLADEYDVVRLRAMVRKEKTYFFPLEINPAQAKVIITQVLLRVNALYEKPEFYNAWLNNCTGNLVVYMRKAGLPMPNFSYRYIFPVSIIELFWKRGLLRKGESVVSVRKDREISARRQCDDRLIFSKCIRGEL